MERIFIFYPIHTTFTIFFTSLLQIQEIRFNRIYLVEINYIKRMNIEK